MCKVDVTLAALASFLALLASQVFFGVQIPLWGLIALPLVTSLVLGAIYAVITCSS